MNPTWTDFHIHVSDIGPDGTKREHMLDDLLAVLDRSGADLRFVISCDFPYMTHMRTDPQAMWDANRMIYNLVRRAPDRLYGSCTVNPNFPDQAAAVMKTCFDEWGFVQLGEMLQYMMDYRMDSDLTEPLLRLAVQYDVPVQVHIGTYSAPNGDVSGAGLDQITDLLGAARRVPEAKYVFAHAVGVGPSDEYVPWADTLLDILGERFGTCPDHFWIEVRDFQSPALPRLIREVPCTRILAGTDWTTRVGPPFQPYGTMFGVADPADNPFPPSVASMIAFLRDAGADDEAIEQIGSGNARELLGI